ncbi:MAG TPA: radical SAM protein [Verrucomicrobiae bacterium]|nr:radical SAM protein [Verrucomicrobiae bacterium]
MILALILGTRCNAACGHCSTSCGPTRTEVMAEETIVRLMGEAAAASTGEPLKFALSGGEPFLDLPMLLRVIAHGHRLGGEVTCVSNGYWATSPEKARSVLQSVKGAGLTKLGLSASRFHQEFVKLKRVERALAAGREVGLHCTVKYARPASDPLDEEAIRAWALAAGANEVQIFAVMPHLRAGLTLPEAEYERTEGIPTGTCPAAIFTVRENGDAFTCCTPGSDIPFFSLGNANEARFDELLDRYYAGGVQQILRDEGPIHFARAAAARGLANRLRPSYADVCDLCTHIANDPQLAAVAAECAEELETRQIHDLLAEV